MEKGQGVQEEQVEEEGLNLGKAAAWAGEVGEGLPALCDSEHEDSEAEDADSDSDDDMDNEEVRGLPGPGGGISDSEEEAPVLEDMAGETSTAGFQAAVTGRQPGTLTLFWPVVQLYAKNPRGPKKMTFFLRTTANYILQFIHQYFQGENG